MYFSVEIYKKLKSGKAKHAYNKGKTSTIALREYPKGDFS